MTIDVRNIISGTWIKITDIKTGAVVCKGPVKSVKTTDFVHDNMQYISTDGKWFLSLVSGAFDVEVVPQDVPVEFTTYDDYTWKYWRDSQKDTILADVYRDFGYDEIDSPCVPLVHELNEWSGLETFQSCCGHESGRMWITICVTDIGILSILLNTVRSPKDAPDLFGKFYISFGDESNSTRLHWRVPGMNQSQPISRIPQNSKGEKGCYITLTTKSIGKTAYADADRLAEKLKDLRLNDQTVKNYLIEKNNISKGCDDLMAMSQCGIFNNCNGTCKFCLIKDEGFFTLPEIYDELDKLMNNIRYIGEQEEGWTTKFSDGISLLGGELYYIKDEKYKEKFLELIDVIIEEVLLKSPNPNVKFSTVTNGYYDPEWLLFPVIDKIVNAVGAGHIDVNFSYDFKYRFKDEAHEKRVRDTINAFHDRYNYIVGVQMIMTQDVVNMINDGWLPQQFIDEKLPGNQLCFLYPHPICRGNGFTGAWNLPNFNFTRPSFLKAMTKLKKNSYKNYESFYRSVQNSSVFKYTMLYEKKKSADYDQQPVLCGGKEVFNDDCGHSVLYQCYSDCDKCILCDLEAIGL